MNGESTQDPLFQQIFGQQTSSRSKICEVSCPPEKTPQKASRANWKKTSFFLKATDAGDMIKLPKQICQQHIFFLAKKSCAKPSFLLSFLCFPAKKRTKKTMPPSSLCPNKTSWWLNQPIWKICSSKWIISPGIRGENNKIFELPPPSNLLVSLDKAGY